MSNGNTHNQSLQGPTTLYKMDSQSSISHAIKRNIGSSTTSLTAFALSHSSQPLPSQQQQQLQHQQHNQQMQQQLPIPVSLSPFEYATPALMNSPNGYFNGHHSGPQYDTLSKSDNDLLMNLDSAQDLDFDTAYNMMNDTIDKDTPKFPSNSLPRTPEQGFASLQDLLDPFLDHRRAIIEAGLKDSTIHHLNQPQSQQQLQLQFLLLLHQMPNSQRSPFSVSPHTRKLLNSVNNLASQYHVNSSGYELLSITESSALEKFLDSIVDDSKLQDLGKHWSTIDPLAKSDSELTLPRLVTATNTDTKPRLSHIPDLRLHTQKFDYDINTSQPVNPVPPGHYVSLSYTLSPVQSPPELKQDQTLFEQAQPVKKKRGRKRKEESVSVSPPVKKPKKVKSEEPEKVRMKRQGLTAEQKKLHHTESEKKRRAIIKELYDSLLRTIDVDLCYHLRDQKLEEKKKKKGSRGNSRFAVMNYVINEVEYLMKENQTIRDKLTNSGVSL